MKHDKKILTPEESEQDRKKTFNFLNKIRPNELGIAHAVIEMNGTHIELKPFPKRTSKLAQKDDVTLI
jgi:hypothetical protein